MSSDAQLHAGDEHQHVFLGSGHAANERKAWAVIGLCSAMMLIEIGGGIAFGSLALVADGLHMSTHAIAMLIAALAYTFARKHATDARFSFGTGKVGDLAGFSSAIVLALIAFLIGYEAVVRFLAPVPISFREAIPIACLGLIVNVVSAWLLSGGDDHHHGHAHGHDHDHGAAGDSDGQNLASRFGTATVEIAEAQGPPRFRLRIAGIGEHAAHGALRDHNLRAAFIHVAADAAVSVLAILGLTAARFLGWVWMDPVMGIVGALVISTWAYALVRDTGRILLDMTPDTALLARIRRRIEADGDRVADLHLWRLGPGHLGAIVTIVTQRSRDPSFYRSQLNCFPTLSHVTVEVANRPSR
jgi:cation diffusion facilitator family transporter